MGTFSIWHVIIAGVVILLLFGGRGKISNTMGDVAKGIRAFREGLKDEGKDEAHEEEVEPAKPLPKATAAKSGAKTAARSTAKSKA